MTKWPRFLIISPLMSFVGGGILTLIGALAYDPVLFALGLVPHVWGGKTLGLLDDE